MNLERVKIYSFLIFLRFFICRLKDGAITEKKRKNQEKLLMFYVLKQNY